MYANQQIISGNKSIYAEKGDRLTIVNSDHHPVMICLTEKGDLIPVK